MTMADFFSMGGYAGYIWPAYAIPTVLMLAIWLLSRKGLADSWHTLAALENDLTKTREKADSNQSESKT